MLEISVSATSAPDAAGTRRGGADRPFNRRTIIATLAVALCSAPAGAVGQSVPKLPRIGVLAPSEGTPSDPVVGTFPRALRELGHVEGRTIAIEWRFARGQAERFAELIGELLRLGVDVLVVGSTAAALAAKKATATVPIVFVGAADPVGAGLVASFARPGGNVTGVSFAFEEGVGGKMVDLLKEAVPRMSRMASLGDEAYPASPTVRGDIQAAARRLGLAFDRVTVRGPAEIDGALAAMARAGAGGVLVEVVPFFNTHYREVVAGAAKYRVPAIYGFRFIVEAGGLLSYGVDLADLWRRAATYVDRVLKGQKPANIPVERPTKFELVVNLETARTLGLTISRSLLLRADHVIQ